MLLWGKSLQLPYANEAILTQFGLSFRKRPPPVNDPLGLTFWELWLFRTQ